MPIRSPEVDWPQMWPLYDPSVYQPASPDRRLAQDEFAKILAELEHKPDVDSVYEVLTTLRGQERLRPSGLPLRKYILHPFMIVPALVLVGTVGLFVYSQMQASHLASQRLNAQLTNAVPAPTAGGMIYAVLMVLFVVLLAIRSALRTTDPQVLAMRSAAAASLTRMALHPKYIHEAFNPGDRDYIYLLLKKRSRESNRALKVLLSRISNAEEPDPEFRGGEGVRK